MKKLTCILAIFILTISVKAQTKQQADSINHLNDSIANLIQTKMVITAALIDTTMDRIKSTITVKEYDKWSGAYQFFINQLVATWLIKNGELEKKKK